MNVKIYGLIDPFDKKIMYIGKTTLSLNRRLGMHISKSKKNKTKKDKWITNILNSNSRPEIILLIDVPIHMANKKEIEWIEHFNISNLVNGNLGGGGNNGKGKKRNESYKHNFRAFMIESTYSKRTVINSICYVNKFINWFKSDIKSPREINSKDISMYLETIKNSNTRNATIVALKLFYSNIIKQPYKLKEIKYEYF